ncbi:MAG: hypothetical protein F4X48_02175 [Acidimicrobiia bacterium]|nr:hypothetical protein [Acidimicrobiia bacterium]MYC57387.1 hypothetical protein [Acidimicrobiia bacterium]MYI31128.1 hypothetical protein [Acidimicrobiia bacterium]
MRFLCDAVFPQTLSSEAPAEVEFVRWDRSDVSDAELVRASGERGCRGVIFWGQDSLQQVDLREIAQEIGVALVAVEADDPIDAKQRILKNLSRLRRKLDEYDCLIVLANEVRLADIGCLKQ